MRIKDNLPTLFVGLVVAFSFIMVINHAKADSITPQQFADNLSQVPVKVQSFISSEIEKTKEYQTNQWSQMKADLLKLKNIFIKN